MLARGTQIGDSSAITVRRMSVVHVPAVLSILGESPEASMWSGEALLGFIPGGAAWVAELDGRVAGFLIGRAAADEFEILNLAVGGANRRRGVGTSLISVALEAAQFAGARQAYLEVRASNEGGIALYTRLGFQVCGRRPNYYRDPAEDAVLLVFTTRETSA